MSVEDKKRALDVFLGSMAKKYGDSAARIATEKVKEKYVVIPTGSALIDDAIGVGGIPRGTIIEIYGQNGAGKSSTADLICSNAQKLFPDEMIGWVDVENAKNWTYSKELGVDDSRVVFSQPSSGEEALDTLIEMCETGAFSVIVLDSVGALRTKRQLEKELDENTVGEVARLMSNALSPLASAAKRTNTLVILLNQIRESIGMYSGGPAPMGGKAIGFYASLRLQIKKREVLVDKEKNPIGQVQEYIFKKNRFGVPFKEVSTEFFFGKGFNKFKEVIDLGLDKGVLAKSGAWFYPLPDNRDVIKFNGKDKMIDFFADNIGAFEDLSKRIKALLEDGEIVEPDISLYTGDE